MGSPFLKVLHTLRKRPQKKKIRDSSFLCRALQPSAWHLAGPILPIGRRFWQPAPHVARLLQERSLQTGKKERKEGSVVLRQITGWR
jgi:hypothetical protein